MYVESFTKCLEQYGPHCKDEILPPPPVAYPPTTARQPHSLTDCNYFSITKVLHELNKVLGDICTM
jgi:hypothetical protein